MSNRQYNPAYNSGTSNAMYPNAACVKENPNLTMESHYYQYPNNFQINAFNNMDLYNLSPSGTQTYRNQSTMPNYYQENVDFSSWNNRSFATTTEKDKAEKIEVAGQELSPVLCSLDTLAQDCYKNKDVYNNQCLYSNCSQKSYELPSCAQMNRNYRNNYDCYLNEQKNDYFFNNFSNKQDQIAELESTYFSDVEINAINLEALQPTLDQQTECSNEDSDIIVEESDEDATDYSEEPEKLISNQLNKCIVCNLIYTPLGTQFYYLTSENPLTMSSQKPVVKKINELVGSFIFDRYYLCSECLGLINTIDHLQLKVDSFISELKSKFDKTCTENKIKLSKIQDVPKNKQRLMKYKCKICKKVLCIKTYCQYHLKRHKFSGYLCESCGKVFSNKHKFKLHKRNHAKKIVKISAYQCKNCKKSFRTKTNFKEHENFCLGLYPYHCKYQHCDKKFASKAKLKYHVKLKHDKKFTAICSICNIGFVNVSNYKSHMNTHSTDKKYSCEKCGKTYKTLSNLNFHLKVHKEKMPYNCNICSKGFMRKEYLEAHVNNHNGVKNYECSICNKKFVSQKNLDSHLKYLHEGNVKKNTCNVCGKIMTSGFEEHLRIHSNLLEFECEICNMRFNTKGALSKHKKRKHS